MARIHKKFENWFAKLTAVVYDHKYIALVCILLITVALIGQIPKLQINTRDENLFHADDPALIAYNEFRDTFGQDNQFIIAMRPHNGLTPKFISTLNELHNELEASVPYIDDITSLINARIVNAEGDMIIVDELMKDLPATKEELNQVMDIIDRYPLYDNLLVSEDRTIMSILIKARAVKDVEEDELLEGFEQEASRVTRSDEKYLSNEENIEISSAINKVINRYQGQGIDFYIAGIPVLVSELTSSIKDDMGKMIPLSFMLIILFLLGLFRRISGVIYPLIIVFLSLLCTLGVMGMWGIPITMITQILPSFILVVGIGDSVHILTIFYRIYRNNNDKRRAIIESIGYAGLPVLMTSVTTASGLLSLTIADNASIAQLGYVAPVGVMLAFFYTVVLLPALIGIFPVKPGKPIPDGTQPIADRMFDAISRVTTRRPLLVMVVFALLLTGALYGAASVKFSQNILTWFPKTSPVRVATEMIDKINGGSVVLEALVDSGRENGLHNPELRRFLR